MLGDIVNKDVVANVDVELSDIDTEAYLRTETVEPVLFIEPKEATERAVKVWAPVAILKEIAFEVHAKGYIALET